MRSTFFTDVVELTEAGHMEVHYGELTRAVSRREDLGAFEQQLSELRMAATTRGESRKGPAESSGICDCLLPDRGIPHQCSPFARH